MKRVTVRYHATYRPTPVSYWAHRHLDDDVWIDASAFEPPLPKPVPGRGYAELEVECDGVVLFFASRAELDQVIDVLSRNPLPTTRRLSQDRGTAYGPNNHWLSRLPARAKPAAFRAKLVRLLITARDDHSELR